MRWIAILALTASALAAEETTKLDDARVTISYGELRRLVEAAQKQPPPAPPQSPIASAILSAEYDLGLEGKIARGNATFQVQSFRDGPQVVPLLGSAAKVASIEPADTVLVQQDGRYAVVLEGKVRKKIVLNFAFPLGQSNTGWQGDLAIPLSVMSSLNIRNIKPDEIVAVEDASLQENKGTEARWQLGAIPSIRISCQEKPKAAETPAPELPRIRIDAPAIVKSSRNGTRIVRDGSYINTAIWTVRHEGQIDWTLTLPEGCQLLSCRVAGETASPLQKDERTIVVPLPPPDRGDETRVDLTFTGRKSEFDPVRGEFELELPVTPLLVEDLSWDVELPRPYETVAIQGNVDFLPAEKPGQMRLTRELGRGDAARVHVFYQKPETTKK